MTITINFDQTPDELIIELFNVENDYSLTTSQVSILPGYRDLLTGRRKLSVELLDPELLISLDVDIPFADISLQPIVLAELFSQVPLELRERDIVDDDLALMFSKVASEILRRYGIRIHAEMFELKEDEGVYILAPLPVNQAYKGEAPITIVRSLQSRIANTQLVGFFTKPDLEFEITTAAITPFEPLADGFDMERLTWFQNFTSISELFTVVNGVLSQREQLNNTLTNMGIPEIPEGVTVALRTVRESSGENPKYTHILRTVGLPNNETHFLHFYGE